MTNRRAFQLIEYVFMLFVSLLAIYYTGIAAGSAVGIVAIVTVPTTLFMAHKLLRKAIASESAFERYRSILLSILLIIAAFIGATYEEIAKRRVNQSQLVQVQGQFFKPTYIPTHTRLTQQLFYKNIRTLSGTYDTQTGWNQWRKSFLTIKQIPGEDIATYCKNGDYYCDPFVHNATFSSGSVNGYKEKGKYGGTRYLLEMDNTVIDIIGDQSEEIEKFISSLTPIRAEDVEIKQEPLP